MPSVIQKPTLHSFFNYCVKNSIPVACYSLPGTGTIQVMAQTSAQIHAFTESLVKAAGFVFAPFETGNIPALLIKADIQATDKDLPGLDFATPLQAAIKCVVRSAQIKGSNKAAYCQYVQATKNAIKQGQFKKAVAARISKISKPTAFHPVSFFKKLTKAYPNAFVSLVYTPVSGIWIGATPEVLLSVEGKQYTTYSLAGTQKRNDLKTQEWDSKEIEEQKFVSSYILQAFAKLTDKKPQVQGPETITAANLAHLRTTFTFKGIAFNQWQSIVAKLHPTPAVGGLPKNKAVEFIIANEKAPRFYYSGYLGPVTTNEVRLFVNLRCMTVLEKQLSIYTGCGITKDSVPEKEWQETLIKKRTLTNVLR